MSSQGVAGETAIERFGQRMADVIERWMPSPFLFAIILSYIVFLAGIVVEGAGPVEMVFFWFDGFWLFLEFAMQMTLILMTGYVVAYHPRVNRALRRLTYLPNDGKQAAALVGAFSMGIAWIHWGFSLIIGAIFAREMGKTAYERGIDAHYPLLCVAGYMGLGLTWHWGLSGSAPLLLNTPGNEFIELGMVDSVVSTTETVFSSYALSLSATSIVFASLALYALAPSGGAKPITDYVPEENLNFEAPGAAVAGTAGDGADVPAERIDNSRLLGGVIALTAIAVVGYTFLTEGLGALNLNVLNFGFLFLGLAIYARPRYYRERFGDAAEAAAGIILLFPFLRASRG